MGVSSLFPIQAQCFKPIYDGEDLIGRDLTGSGKTLAFCLPLVERYRKARLFGERSTLKSIILAPTRELALQISKVLKCLRHSHSEFNVITVYGGVPIYTQTKEFNRGVDFFVGTTGRVLDHINRGNIDFSHLKSIALDEADEMLNMGFAEDIERIIKAAQHKVSEKLQVLLFSATIPSWVNNAARKYMTADYKYINLTKNLSDKTPKNVVHLLMKIPVNVNSRLLESLFRKYCSDKDSKTIVFTETKREANSISDLDIMRRSALPLHGDVPQKKREVILRKFREGRIRTLVATDVASRGLDIPKVNLIVQLKPPKNSEAYIHRSGRTGRAGNEGICITLCDKYCMNAIRKIERDAGIRFKEIYMEDLESSPRRYQSSVVSTNRSLMTNQRGLTTFIIYGKFRSKSHAYQILLDSFPHSVVDLSLIHI